MTNTNTTKRTVRRRCSRCGKLSNNRTGEYVRKDGSAGYISYDEDSEHDLCTDCIEAETESKSFYVLGQSRQSGVLIRCADKDIAEHEMGLMRYSDCYRIARTSRPTVEASILAWFTADVAITKRDSRFNRA